MKRILSLILALITVMSVATVMTSAATADVAQSNAINYQISNTPFEEVAGAKIIGYLGDVDMNKNISILDATQVQLTLASIIALDSTARLLADTDLDGSVSILDATAIQCFLAQIETSSKVAHTVYEKTSPEKPAVYEQIVSFMKNNASYSPELGMYRLRKDNSGNPDYMTICYYENSGEISILYHTGEGDEADSFELIIKNNNKRATFNATNLMGGSKYYSVFGEIELIDADKKKVDFHPIIFNSDLGISESSAKTSLNSQLSFTFMYLKGVMQNNLDGNLYTLFN